MAQKKHSAFTLIEMVIVLFIISLLLLIIIPNVNPQKNQRKVKLIMLLKPPSRHKLICMKDSIPHGKF